MIDEFKGKLVKEDGKYVAIDNGKKIENWKAFDLMDSSGRRINLKALREVDLYQGWLKWNAGKKPLGDIFILVKYEVLEDAIIIEEKTISLEKKEDDEIDY